MKVVFMMIVQILSGLLLLGLSPGLASRQGDYHDILSVDGSTHTTLVSAFEACPSSGCVIDMRGNASPTARSLGKFDPGTTPVTILLGPYSYTGAFTLRSNLTVLGIKGVTNLTQT